MCILPVNVLAESDVDVVEVPVVVPLLVPLDVSSVSVGVLCVVWVESARTPVSLTSSGAVAEHAQYPSIIQRSIVHPYALFDYSLFGVSDAPCLARMGMKRSREVPNANFPAGYDDGIGVGLWR